MPGEVIDHPNPQPLPSQIPDDILKFAVEVDKKTLPEDVNKSLKDFKSAALYIAAGELTISSSSSYFADLSSNDFLEGQCPLGTRIDVR